jgi:hypothetical protein
MGFNRAFLTIETFSWIHSVIESTKPPYHPKSRWCNDAYIVSIRHASPSSFFLEGGNLKSLIWTPAIDWRECRSHIFHLDLVGELPDSGTVPYLIKYVREICSRARISLETRVLHLTD